jgi:hypothetical protein
VRSLVLVFVAALVLAGCGGSSSKQSSGPGTRTVTHNPYGGFSGTTVVVTTGDPQAPLCKQDAVLFGRDAVQFIQHSGADAAYPADLYYYNAKGVYDDFTGHACDPALLAADLKKRLTPAQQREFVRLIPNPISRVVGRELAR